MNLYPNVSHKLKHLLLITCCIASVTGCSTLVANNEKTVKQTNKNITQPANKKPNVIWLVLEDISLEVGSYGDTLVKTPNLDKLSKMGTRYTNAYATSPVCSPTRSAFFTGMNQTSIGAHHHRSHLEDGYQLPQHVKMLSEYLRDEGYYNLLMGPKQKTDFNFSHIVSAFDATDGEIKYSGGAYTHAPIDRKILGHRAWNQYKKEAPEKPFFAQINYSETHRTFIADPKNPINPDDVKLPSYYPDHELVRRDWALYLETVQTVDQKVGNLMAELEAAGALENTIVFVFGDHGRAMLRDKQWLYDGGLRVPLIVFGKGIAQGKVSDELVSLIDLAPTTLDMIGADVPDYMEGHVFIGKNTKPRNHVFAQRDRCDETDDRIRSVRGKRFHYIKNFYPEQPYTQFNAYKKLQYPVLTLMQKLHEEGKLTPTQALFFADSRPPEELYDTYSDPEEVNNLADDPRYKAQLARMRSELTNWQERTGDMGMIDEAPEDIAYWDNFFAKHFKEEMNSRGLPANVDHDTYLKWWDKFLKDLGK
ncbi:sulfatase family protein [Pseudocolwellia agarivorans]|uniref:sulfatase family protein n=1 Tax=Pseudocolwellia agarivorans TaxID=1911682 RepID=UPI0009872A60|nr:sulfatase [Pseudocolwellia agarivorans]